MGNDPVDQYDCLIFKCMNLFITTIPLVLEPHWMAHGTYGAVNEAPNSLNRRTTVISCSGIMREILAAEEMFVVKIK